MPQMASSASPKKLTLRYALALSLIALLCLLSYGMLQKVISEQTSSAAVVNFAGKRRYLSQKTLLHSLEILHAGTQTDRANAKALQRATVDLLEQTHHALIHGDEKYGLPGHPPAAVREIYFGQVALDRDLREFVRLNRAWADLPDAQRTANHPLSVSILAVGPNQILSKLDQAVLAYQYEVEHELAYLANLENVVLLATLTLLLLEVFLIFRPMVRIAVRGINEVEASREFLDAVINALPDSIVVKDKQHRWLFVNETFARFLGRERSELVGLLDHDVFTQHVADACRKQDLLVFGTHETHENEEVLQDAFERERTVLIKKSMAKDPSGRTVLIGAIRDITHLRSVERDLQEARLETLQSSKMATLGEVAAGIAHEINTPLTAISLRAEHVRREVETGRLHADSVLESTHKIQGLISNVGQIVHSLQTLSRRDFDDPKEDVALGTLVSNTASLCAERLLSGGIRLEIDDSLQDLQVSAHPSQLAQVVLNLLTNAVDALENTQVPWIRIAAITHKGYVELSVTDSGPGIPAAIRHRVLDPFFTTKPAGAGTGLGLSISKRIIEHHGGELFFDAFAPHTKVVVRLPNVHAAADCFGSKKRSNPAAGQKPF